MAKKNKHKNHRPKGIMGRSDIPYAQRLQMKQSSDIAVNREQSAKVTLYCLSVALNKIKHVGYTRLIRYSHRYMEYEREFYQDIELGMAHAKTRMEQMKMPISGELFTEKIEGLTKRKQEVHDNSLQAIQIALTVGAIAMNDEFGYGESVQFEISEYVTELTERYRREGIKFLLDEMERIGFLIENGSARFFLDDEGNPITPKRAKKEGYFDD